MYKLGLVLAGGGGKGSYQIGVWKAIIELGLDKYISAIAGTSVGALNACLIHQGNYEIAEKIWLDDKLSEKILCFNEEKEELIIKRILKATSIAQIPFAVLNSLRHILSSGIFSRAGMEEISDNSLNFDYLINSNIPVFATISHNYPFNRKPVYFNLKGNEKDKIKKTLLATSAIPIAFGKENIDKVNYVDGGLVDNVPVQPLYDYGCNIIIVVHLSRDYIIDFQKFPNSKIIEIVPQNFLGNLFEGTLKFDRDTMQERILLGYKDAMDILKSVFEILHSGAAVTKSIELMINNEVEYIRKNKEIDTEIEDVKRQINRYKK